MEAAIVILSILLILVSFGSICLLMDQTQELKHVGELVGKDEKIDRLEKLLRDQVHIHRAKIAEMELAMKFQATMIK